MGQKQEERTAARDYLLARLAACRGALSSAERSLDIALEMFIDPSEDPKGAERSELLEAVDAAIGDAARAVQAAMPAMVDIDPKEAEPESEDDDEDEEDDEDEDE